MINDFIRRSQDAVKMVNLKASLINSERLLSVALENLGKAVFLERGGVVPSSMADKVPQLENSDFYMNEIKGIVKTIDEIHQLALEARGLKKCDKCGSFVPLEMKYCGNCGSAMPVAPKPEEKPEPEAKPEAKPEVPVDDIFKAPSEHVCYEPQPVHKKPCGCATCKKPEPSIIEHTLKDNKDISVFECSFDALPELLASIDEENKAHLEKDGCCYSSVKVESCDKPGIVRVTKTVVSPRV